MGEGAHPPQNDGASLLPGDKKEALGAAVFAICQALKAFGVQNEEGAWYMVFSNPTAILPRAMSDRIGPGRSLPEPPSRWPTDWCREGAQPHYNGSQPREGLKSVR